MIDERLAVLRSRGYWRVNFQPAQINEIPALKECLDIVLKAKVSLRGWDFPHIPRANLDGDHSIATGNTFYEGYTNSGAYKEFWRFYQSTQFIFLKALSEDWLQEDPFYAGHHTNIQPNTSLGILHSAYFFTEIFEFLKRLAEQELYKDGVLVQISLHNTAQRRLWVDGAGRNGLMYPRITASDVLTFQEQLDHSEVLENSLKISHRLILQCFDKFGFSPDPNAIQIDQLKFVNGQL